MYELSNLLKLPGKPTILIHWHTSVEGVLVAGDLHVTFEGKKSLTQSAALMRSARPKHLHEGHCVNKEARVTFIAFESPLDAMAGNAPKKAIDRISAPLTTLDLG